jgi:hypothetical protein
MHSSVEADLQGLMGNIARVECTCTALVLIENSSGRWRTLRSFTLQRLVDSMNPGTRRLSR